MSRLNELVQRNQLKQGRKDMEETDILRKVHHGLMSKYGWINFEEFMSLPIPTVYGLLIECLEEVKGIEEMKIHIWGVIVKWPHFQVGLGEYGI